jgi:hypothetical protein
MANLLGTLGSIYSTPGKVKLSTAPTKVMTALETDLDWSQYNIFKKDITATSTFTFSNSIDGVSILFLVVNNTVSGKTVNLPAGIKWAGGFPVTIISANTSVIFSLIKIDGTIYCSAIDSIA